MSNKHFPEIVTLSESELDAIKTRVNSYAASEEDKKIILSILSTYQWLYRQLRTTKLSIHRLKNLFGFTTEKRGKRKNRNLDIPSVQGNNTNDSTPDDAVSDTGVTSGKKFSRPNGIFRQTTGE